ncbi:MAG: MFS transporter, partial [Bacteroidales bacterium]|nr:MFS transporter [Bacteroidales bacterium]
IGGIAENDAVLSLTFFTIGMMVGRFALGAMMKKGRDLLVLFIYMFIALIGVALMGVGKSSTYICWIAMALIGFGVGATYPVMLARLGGVFRKMSGSAFSAAIFIALCGQFLGNFLMGRLFASGGGNAFAFLLAGMIIAILILAPFACLACTRRKNLENKNNDTIYP